METSGRGRQIIRQWSLLKVLEGARLGRTVEQLVEALDGIATKRTIYRDLKALGQAGFAVESSEGRWQLLREGAGSWSIPVQPTEVLALLFTEQLAKPLEQTSVGESLKGVRDRLRAMLSPTGRKYVSELEQLTFATFFAPGSYDGHREDIDRIQEAVRNEQVLAFEYHKPGKEPQRREVEPYATWFHNGRFYLIAWCRGRDDIRTFSVQRIRSATVLDETFEPDPDFDPAEYARSGFGVYRDEAVIRIEVEFSAGVAHLARERRYHHTQRLRDQPDGSVLMSFEAAGLPEVASWIASFGGKARPVRPPGLVDLVVELHRAGLAAIETQ